MVAFETLQELPAEAAVDKETYAAIGTRANLNIPINPMSIL